MVHCLKGSYTGDITNIPHDYTMRNTRVIKDLKHFLQGLPDMPFNTREEQERDARVDT